MVNLGVAISSVAVLAAIYRWWSRKEIKKVSILDTIGNTPLIYLPKLSKAARCHIFVLRRPLRSNYSS